MDGVLNHGRLFHLPATTMVSLAPHLNSLIKSMSVQPVDELILDSLIQKELNESSKKVSVENRKSQWEYLLKNEVFALAVRLLARY
jgi:hypothetical protein